MKQQINKKWEIYSDNGIRIPGSVPGDITTDLFKAGEIKDPFWGMNHKELGWIIDSDFTYVTQFDLSEDIWQSDEIYLQFDGIDIFSEIYLNGQLLGNTDNMFLKYEYNVKDIAKKEQNTLSVKMISTQRKMNEIDTGDYWGIFNTPRLFIRKVQCQFGWDWAPDMPGYGIYKPVWVEGRSKHCINDISYRAYNNGNLSVSVELNYDVRPMTDRYGLPMEIIPEYTKEDKLIYKVATKPDEDFSSGCFVQYEQKVQGTKSFANFKIEEPELWWPSGYGKQPLYSYCVELVRNGEVLDKKQGTFAFREVRLEQQPISAERLECKIVVNDVPVFAKGSNWVPAECFMGNMQKEKYDKLLTLAKNGNMNMLRVWGGGLYENDEFYEICDRLGIMIWQDMMFACADIPEERPEFVENVKKEITYQIKRLRNHPSIVLWSGGNEKVGTLCKQVSHGDFFMEVILRGLIANLDESRPIIKQSPYGMTELGNDATSGDTHASSYEDALEAGVEKYRDLLSEKVTSFTSECVSMGVGTLESFKKIFPDDKLWPMNEYWDDRFRDNPYAAVRVPFSERQMKYADALYGESSNLEAFICKSMTVHAETLRAEMEYARTNKGQTWGFMNWMYSECWPSGILPVVDYYCEPRQAYYQMKRSFEPILVTFAQTPDFETVLSVVNDELCDVSGELEYGLKTLDREVCWKKHIQIEVPGNGIFHEQIKEEFRRPNTYLYVKGSLNGQTISTVYSHDMWKDYEFKSDYVYQAVKEDENLVVTIKANKFAKGITLRLPENEKYIYSDNYFDLEAGEEKKVIIIGTKEVGVEHLIVTDFANETKK